MSRARRGSLAWRLYGLGLLQLALLAGVFMGVGRLVVGAPPEEPTRQAMPAPGMPPPPGAPPEVGPPAGPLPLPPPWHRSPRLTPVETLFLGGIVIVGIGSLLTARWIVRPLRDLARAARALGAGDLRARSGLRRDDEVGELARTFDEMAGRIEQLVLAEKELLANVSHELRTPLARLRVALDIAGESDPETVRASMAEMGVDLSELETLVNDILTTTRLEIARGTSAAARFELHLEDLDGNALVERVAERFRARHSERSLTVDVAVELPVVHADPVLLRRVLDNLLENAHKYSPDAAAPIVLRAARADGGIAFEVVDRGMGIAEKDQPHLFTPFFRSDTSRARASGGVGLGLTLAKRIVEAHHGTITVTSTLGVGSTFRVLVPAGSATVHV